MNFRLFLTILLATVFGYSLSATEPILIPKTDQEISLDGRIDEEAWDDAIRLNMVMLNPVSGIEPSEASSFLMIYTDRFRVQPSLPGFCCRTLLLKYTYTFTM
jgi:hypothetical protein